MVWLVIHVQVSGFNFSLRDIFTEACENAAAAAAAALSGDFASQQADSRRRDAPVAWYYT